MNREDFKRCKGKRTVKITTPGEDAKNRSILDIHYAGVYEATLEPVVAFTVVGDNSGLRIVLIEDFLKGNYEITDTLCDSVREMLVPYVHVKTNNDYLLLSQGLFTRSPDMEIHCAVYRRRDEAADQTIWVRNWDVFSDGRFKEIVG
jgi:hypothetical protein